MLSMCAPARAAPYTVTQNTRHGRSLYRVQPCVYAVCGVGGLGVSGRSGPPSVTDVHTCTCNDCPRARSCFVRVTDTLYFPCREQSPNSAEQQPLNADAASAPPHNGAREGGPVSPSLVKYLPWLYALPMLLKAVRGSSTVSSRRPVARADRTDHVHAVSEDERRAFLRVAKHILHQMIILVAPAPEEAKR